MGLNARDVCRTFRATKTGMPPASEQFCKERTSIGQEEWALPREHHSVGLAGNQLVMRGLQVAQGDFIADEDQHFRPGLDRGQGITAASGAMLAFSSSALGGISGAGTSSSHVKGSDGPSGTPVSYTGSPLSV